MSTHDARSAPVIELGRAFVAANPPSGRLVVCAVTGGRCRPGRPATTAVSSGAASASTSAEPTAKTMLYSYRVALTGIHLLSTGELETEVVVLAPGYGYHDLDELVAIKGAGPEQGPLPEALDRHHRARWPVLDAQLAEAEATTRLPPEAPNRDEVEAWLVATRLADLERPGTGTGA